MWTTLNILTEDVFAYICHWDTWAPVQVLYIQKVKDLCVHSFIMVYSH